MSRVIGEHIPRLTALGDTVSTRYVRLDDGRECEEITVECLDPPKLQLVEREGIHNKGRAWPSRTRDPWACAR